MDAEFNPRIIYKKCIFCGTRFPCIRSDAETCSTRCRSKLRRWRNKLPKSVGRASGHIKEVASYLDYDLSKPAAIHYLKNLMSEIRAEMERHGVRFIQ